MSEFWRFTEVRHRMSYLRRQRQTVSARQNWLLTAPVEEVLSFSEPTRPVPEKARIFGNVTCAQCGETVHEHKARLHQGQLLCLDCFQPYDRGW